MTAANCPGNDSTPRNRLRVAETGVGSGGAALKVVAEMSDSGTRAVRQHSPQRADAPARRRHSRAVRLRVVARGGARQRTALDLLEVNSAIAELTDLCSVG